MTTDAGAVRWEGWPWGAALVFGALTIGVGVLAIVWPGQTFLVLSVILGIYIIAFGMFWIVAGFSAEVAWLQITGGVLGVLAGALMLAEPIRGAAIVVVIIGAYWLTWGVVQLVTAIFDRGIEHRGWQIVSSLFSVAAGVVTLAWPQITALVVAWVAGIWLIVVGAIEIGRSFEIRRMRGLAA